MPGLYTINLWQLGRRNKIRIWSGNAHIGYDVGRKGIVVRKPARDTEEPGDEIAFFHRSIVRSATYKSVTVLDIGKSL